MRKVTVSMNVSIDGFADHTVAVAADDELHDFFNDLLDDVETLLFGRVTYQLMETYWPHAPEDPQASRSIIAFANKFNAMPKIVFSRTLQRADWNNTRLVRGNVAEEVIKLKQAPGKNLSIGGLSICQELMRLGLVDEYWLLVQPVIWGKGRRLFDGLNERINLRLVDTKEFASGVIVLHYLAGKVGEGRT